MAAKLPDPYPRQNQFMVIEMASAFLLVEHVLDNFTSPAPDIEQQIAIMGGWLLDAAMGKSTGEPPAGVRPDLSERIGALHLRLRQDDPFVIAGDGFPHSGQMSATDETGARLQMEAARWRYVYRLFLAGNRGVLPDASSQSRPHVQR